MQILETERLVVRQLTLDDANDLSEVLSDPQTMRYYPAPFTREQTIGWIEWNLRNYAQYGFGLWAVVRKDDALMLGDCGLTMQPVEGQPMIEIGYHLKRRVRGNGYATEAAQHGHAPKAPPWPAHFSEEEDVEAINAWIYAHNRDRPLQQVLDEYHQSFQRMRDAVAALSERALTEPGRYPWMDGEALAAVITASFGHLHEEHEPALREWLDQIQA